MKAELTNEKMERFFQQCRDAKLRITPQRCEIYKVLMECKDHPSADRVYERVKRILPNISFDTVNRTLLTFSEIGLAFVVAGSGDVKRFDGDMSSHQHFKCIKCKRIVDIRHDVFDNIDVPKELGGNFRVFRMNVLAEGLCEGCVESNIN